MSNPSFSSPESPATIDSAASPPFSPTSPTSPETPAEPPNNLQQQQQALTTLKYKVASHSVRITKNGYAIDPVELRYREILNGLSPASRRASDASFDSNSIGHQVLSLIRGFWSQPAFPKGKVVIRDDKHASLESILAEFSQNPPYPHRETFGGASKQKKSRSKSRSRRRPKVSRISPTGVVKQVFRSKSPPVQADDALSKNIRDKFMPLTKEQQSDNATSSSSSYSSSPTTTSKSTAGSILSAMFSSKPQQPQLINQAPLQASDYYHSWIPHHKEQIFELLKNLCKQMEQIFSNESRVVEVKSPCTVLGDIHGNLSDLRSYERSLWPKAPNCLTCNYLFLGDYVDRGEYSVECVLYLFAMKLISPKRFFLLRGNHEVAAIQRQYTFSKECDFKFGPLGRQMWKNFNKVFDLMPVAAIIDDQIFCAHGGIPRSITDIKRLAREIPSPLDNPEVQCPAAWEILWNDPITDNELIGMIEMDNAVVTQTQITQTQALPDGQETVTTTSSTTIASDVPKTSETNKTTTNQNATTTNEQTDETPEERGLNEADTILTREPSVALSFYIKPDETQSPSRDESNSQQQTDSTKPLSTAAKEALAKEAAKNDDSNTLRTVPSDTSSIASTSPQQIMNDGFVANIKRGTAFLFSDQAINNFLKVNNLSHVIRAHEVIPTGFAFHGDGRVITIFSSSKYCGLNNQAACALVDRERIRILRLDTGDAGE